MNHLVRYSEFVQVRGQPAAISVPAFPFQTTCFEHWFDQTVGEIVEANCAAELC
jgi:hypothetical protein